MLRFYSLVLALIWLLSFAASAQIEEREGIITPEYILSYVGRPAISEQEKREGPYVRFETEREYEFGQQEHLYEFSVKIEDSFFESPDYKFLELDLPPGFVPYGINAPENVVRVFEMAPFSERAYPSDLTEAEHKRTDIRQLRFEVSPIADSQDEMTIRVLSVYDAAKFDLPVPLDYSTCLISSEIIIQGCDPHGLFLFVESRIRAVSTGLWHKWIPDERVAEVEPLIEWYSTIFPERHEAIERVNFNLRKYRAIMGTEDELRDWAGSIMIDHPDRINFDLVPLATNLDGPDFSSKTCILMNILSEYLADEETPAHNTLYTGIQWIENNCGGIPPWTLRGMDSRNWSFAIDKLFPVLEVRDQILGIGPTAKGCIEVKKQDHGRVANNSCEFSVLVALQNQRDCSPIEGVDPFPCQILIEPRKSVDTALLFEDGRWATCRYPGVPVGTGENQFRCEVPGLKTHNILIAQRDDQTSNAIVSSRALVNERRARSRQLAAQRSRQEEYNRLSEACFREFERCLERTRTLDVFDPAKDRARDQCEAESDVCHDRAHKRESYSFADSVPMQPSRPSSSSPLPTGSEQLNQLNNIARRNYEDALARDRARQGVGGSAQSYQYPPCTPCNPQPCGNALNEGQCYEWRKERGLE